MAKNELPSTLVINGRNYREATASIDLTTFTLYGMSVEDIASLRRLFVRDYGKQPTSENIRKAIAEKL